ncbi:MAG: M20/M25/M40 family metallo-hydrolase, partial [Chloroflexi bacterium]|nr:M20/M25/M40 family metallo-hydrolase [Chloroflexota bacterium]
LRSQNIIAVKTGQSEKEIIVGAHYDSVDAGRGADDNASGIAVVLEVAERLVDVETPYTIRFVAFGAEEVGLKGSTYYAGQMSQDEIRNTLFMVNLDSLAAGDNLYVYGDVGEKGVVRNWVLTYANQNHLPIQTQKGQHPDYPIGTTGDWSDHAPFKAAGIQYVYFEATNWTLGNLDGYTQVDPQFGENGEIWHTAYDDIAYITETFPGRLDSHLQVFTHMLFHVLTDYKL